MYGKFMAAVMLVAALTSSAFAQKTASTKAANAAAAEKKIVATLHSMYDAEKRKDLDFIVAHMTGDFAEVAPDGKIYRQADIKAEWGNVVLKDYSLSDCAFNLMASDSAYYTCNMKVDAEFKGQPFPANMRVTWVWVLDKTDWKLSFEQATLIPPATKTDSADVRKQIEVRERAFISAVNNNDDEAVLNMCDSRSVSSNLIGDIWESGAVTLLLQATIKVEQSKMADISVVQIGSDSAMIIYNLSESGWATNSDMRYESNSRVTSIWVNKSGEWKLIARQHVPVREG